MTLEDIIENAHQLLPNIPLKKISQGAEAVVFTTTVHPYLPSEDNVVRYIVKYRPPKPYRHPILDAQLTKHRTLSESRILHKLTTSGVSVPSLIFVDPKNGIIWMEYVGDNINKRGENNEGRLKHTGISGHSRLRHRIRGKGFPCSPSCLYA